ncbi:MAG TPA: AsmA-like C-terminal region-containing protein, partial [Burkholderiales bacterium]|nr:AsmA-like C-terminal region-containing protein [Burkholderiales bacterium]
PPFRGSAHLRDTRAGYRVDDLELRIADSTVSASLHAEQRGPRLLLTGKAASPLLDLVHLLPASGRVSQSAAVSGAPRSVDYWQLADVDLDLNIGRLVLPDGRQVYSASGRLALDKGRLKATTLQATLGGAHVKLDGIVANPQQLAGLDLRIALQGSELAELYKFFGTSIAPVGPYQSSARLHGSRDAPGMTAIEATVGGPTQRVSVSGQIDDAINVRGINLMVTADVSDSTAAGRLLGTDLPRLPALRATAHLTGPEGGYVFDDLRLAMGRTTTQGRVVFVPGEPRPHVTAKLSGPLLDLSELPTAQTKPDGKNPLLVADVEADIRFERVVLPDRRTLGPVSGGARLAAGVVDLKQFSVAVDGASATMDGRIGDPLTLAAVELMVNAQVTRGAGLTALTGLRLQNLPEFTASGKLTDMPNGYALAGLKLAHAATTIAGDVAVTHGDKRFKVSAKASSPVLDISALVRPAATESATKSAAAGARVIPDVPVALDVLRLIDADLELRIDAIKFTDAAPLGPLLVRAAIADGIFKADPVQLAINAGETLSVSGTIDAAQNAWVLRIIGTGINLGDMLVRFGRPALVSGGSTDLALQVQGRGKSLAAILGSINGDARVKVGPHRVHNFAVDPDSGIFLRVLNLANPFQKTDPDTDVRCIAARVPIRDGVLTSDRNMAVETTKYNAFFSGTVNLGTEVIDAAVTPIVGGNITTIVRVGGTLSAPVVGVDPVGAVTSAASAGAALAVPAWLIAESLLKKVISDPNPCATALAE